MPKQYAMEARPHHPFLDTYAHTVDYDAHFASAVDVKRAIAGYAGLVSTMDENVGHVLRALRDAGLEQDTRVIYTSDHGDNVGARGLWGKSTLYEESAGVPLIVAGPDVPVGRVIATPVSHIDCAPTILRAAGLPPSVGSRTLPGASLFDMANGATSERPVISEYHATGSTAGAYMLRFGNWKYCHYVGAPSQLFDLAADSEELTDIARDPRFAATLAEGERRLRAVLDPEATDARAKRRQAELLAQFGGRDKALAHGDLGFTPAPGTAAEINY
jgi:choline-sulfatase